MEKNHKSKNGVDSPEEKKSNGKKIPIIQTLKPKKRLTKNDKELIKVTKEAMKAIGRNQIALAKLIAEENNAEI